MKREIEQRLKEALQQPFVNSQRFLDDIIFPVFGDDNFESAGNLNVLKTRQDLQPKADTSGITSIRKVGDLLIDGSELGIFDITLDYKKQLQRNRVEVQQIIRTIISTHSGAFIIFHYESGARWEWRFTFCHKGASNADSTDAKRYTYLLGPGQSCRTAAENFMKLHDKIENEGEFEMDDIIRAFDVEALSKEFFTKYKAHYERFCQFVYDHRNEPAVFGSFFAACEEKIIRDYVKKLLGRLVFLQFLQKKRWLGGQSSQWNDGDPDFLQHLFANATTEQKQDFLDSVLEPLFQDALDTNRAATNQDFDTGVEGFRCCKIPYLNGGLFGKDKEIDEANSDFPAEYFQELFDFFYQYNFTIDENDPNDAEVGIDPEMLGRIFENLLEDNKDKGAFYTPKTIVQYMCRESLIAYLQNGCKSERARQAARDFVETHDADPLRQLRMEKPDGTVLSDSVLDFFDTMLRKVKICDPAIGSGAFPMGMLRELYDCRAAIKGFDHATAAEIKKDIIQNNIYGVDIEKGAVDIARLRFWLTLILDEEDPKALPNLDFKIMQGNSLLESFHGLDLSAIAVGKQKATKGMKVNARTLQGSFFFQDEQEAMKEIQQCIRRYYSTESHSAKQILYAKIENAIRQYLYYRTEGRPDLQAEVETLPLCNSQFFLWHTFFADVFEQGGFDIVIGNPPYGANFNEEEKRIIKATFKSYKYKFESYVYFIELAFRLLNKNGIVEYITPTMWLSLDNCQPIRQIVLENDFMSLCIYGDNVFESAVVNTCSFTISKKKPSDNLFVKLGEDEIMTLSKNLIVNPQTLKIEYRVNPQQIKIISKIINLSTPLKQYGEIIQGITPYDSARGQSKEIIKNRAYHSHNCIDKTYGHWIEGKDLSRYYLGWSGEWLSYGPWLAAPRDKKFFEGKRILFREIPGKGKRIQACITNEVCYYGHSISPFKPYPEYIEDLNYILAIINSRLISWFGALIMPNLCKDIFPKINPKDISILPIPNCTNKKIFTNLVDHILSAKKIDSQADTSSLEAEIDRLVYDLYGLTKEEIDIVEGTNS